MSQDKTYIYFKVSFIIAFLVVLTFMFLSSCQTKRSFIKKGISKGWIDTSFKQTTAVFYRVNHDTLYRDSLVSSSMTQLDSIFKKDTIYKWNKVRITKIITKKCEEYKESPVIKDTVHFTGKNGELIRIWQTGDKLNFDVIYKTFKIEAPRPWVQQFFLDYWWLMVLILLIILSYLWVRKKQ